MRRWDASSYAQQRGHRAAAGIDGVRGAMVVIGMRGDGGMYVCILVVCMCVCMYVCIVPARREVSHTEVVIKNTVCKCNNDSTSTFYS